jgi:hypothetical protein
VVLRGGEVSGGMAVERVGLGCGALILWWFLEDD